MKIPTWTIVHDDLDITKMSWANDILRVQFDHPLYYYKYTGVPGEIWDLLVRANEINAKKLGSGLTMSVRGLFNHLVRNHPQKYPFTKMILPAAKT